MSQDTKYEIMYIIRPDVDEEARTALVERFDTILKDNGAEVIESKDWEKCRLVYKMSGFREDIYHIVNVASPLATDTINGFDRLTKINDDIIRHMIVKVGA